MKVIIVRHGQTDENTKGGDASRDSEALLTYEGILQVKKLGHALKGHRITYAYSSPQKRAINTAEEILFYHSNAKIEHVDNLREQNLGKFSVLPKNVIREIHKQSGKPFADFRPEEGESYADVQKRVTTFLHNLVQKHQNEDVILIVSHGGTLGMLLLSILEKEITEENYKTYKPENSAVTIIEIFKDKPIAIHTINDVNHLN